MIPSELTQANEITDIEIKRAAQLSIVEISIGSIGHGFKIPLTGQVLSLNQLGFLLNALNKDQLPVSAVFEISSIAAVLKSFSPAGQKLGPMLSIAMQGFLFWVFNLLFQRRWIGQVIGALFLALWSFVQPLITYFLIYGFELVKIFEFYEKRLAQDYAFIHQSLAAAVILVISVKLLLAVGLVIYSVRTKKEIRFLSEEKIQSLGRLGGRRQEKPGRSPWVGAFRDITRPIFLLSFILMVLFIWQFEGATNEKIWLALRPLATAYLIFYIVRSPWISAKLFQLSQKSDRFGRIYQKAQKALDLVAQRSSRSAEVSARRQLE